jgi:hypothetical protein
MEYFEKYDNGRLNIFRDNYVHKIFIFTENLSTDYTRVNADREYVLMSVEFILEKKIPYYIFNFYIPNYDILNLVDYYNIDQNTLIQVKLKMNMNSGNVLTHENYYIKARDIEITSTNNNHNIFFEKTYFLSELNTQREKRMLEQERRTRDLFLLIEYSYSDNLETIKIKNPNVKFTDVGDVPEFIYKSIEGQYLTTTETQLAFDQRGRLYNVVATRRGAALDVYIPLVEKYTGIYGSPKESTPLTTNLSRGISSATSFHENDRGSVILLLIIPLDGINIPYIMIIESYKYND